MEILLPHPQGLPFHSCSIITFSSVHSVATNQTTNWLPLQLAVSGENSQPSAPTRLAPAPSPCAEYHGA